jgi:hypothetical protein
MRASSRVVVASLAVSLLSAVAVRAAPEWDRAVPTFEDALEISDGVVGDDVQFARRVLLTNVQAWLHDGAVDDDGELGSFGGTLSWALYPSDGLGFPLTSSDPIATGSAAELVLDDTGLDDASGRDVVRARFELRPPVELSPNRVWFVLHEGTWGSLSDGSFLLWGEAPSIVLHPAHEASWNPGTWIVGDADHAVHLVASPLAGAQLEVDAGFDGYDISTQVFASDVFVDFATEVTELQAFLVDGDAGDDGALGSFGGTLGWAIYQDAAGKPGALVASGEGPATAFDTGLQSVGDHDIVRVEVPLGQTVSLAAETLYWLAFHEGDWGSPADGSTIRIARANGLANGGSWADPDETDPGDWPTGGLLDGVYALDQRVLFVSGFESDNTCAWSVSLPFDCP